MTDYTPALRPRPGGTAITLRVVPRARRPGLDGLHASALRLRVAAPPAEGKANAEVVAVLARLLGVRRADVSIGAGAKGRDKTAHVRGLAPDEVAVLLARA